MKIPKKIKSFLGMTRFYQKFIHRYSHVAEPLTRLLRKDLPYSWIVECQVVFESLKDALSTTPILKSLEFGKPFHVTCDTSGKVVARVLSQEGRPVAYELRKLKDA